MVTYAEVFGATPNGQAAGQTPQSTNLELKGTVYNLTPNGPLWVAGDIPIRIPIAAHTGLVAQIMFSGSGLSLIATAKVSLDGVNFYQAADPNAKQTYSASGLLECTVSGHWAIINLSSLSGSPNTGQGVQILVMPYRIPGPNPQSAGSISAQGTQGVNVAAVGGTTVTSPLPVSVQGAAGAGHTPYFNSGLSNTVVNVKTSKGTLQNYHIYNSNTADMFVQVFNDVAANIVLGTNAPAKVFHIPASGTLDGGDLDVAFGTAISIAATTTATGSTAPPTALLVNLDYD